MAGREIIFLDTTFILPFFQIPIDVKNFDKKIFEKSLRRFRLISVSELSLIEALFIVTKMFFRGEVFRDIFEVFRDNLEVLEDDSRFVVKSFSSMDISSYKWLLDFKDLNPIDRLILAQGLDADIFLTENREILKIGGIEKFRKKFSVKIVDWKHYISSFK